MNRRALITATSSLLLIGLLPTAAQAAPGSATLRVTLDKGCASKITGPKLSKKVKASTTLKNLRPGTYTITSKCGPKKRVKLKRGQRKKVRFTKDTELLNPRSVPTTISGTFEGSNLANPGPGVGTTWQGTVTLTRTTESLSLDSLNFPFAAHYKVTALSGTVRPVPLQPNPDLCYGQTGSRTFGIDDADDFDGGDSFPGGVYDPWGWAGRGTVYNILVATITDGWSEVGTELCPSPNLPPSTEPYYLGIPRDLLLTDGWTGLPSNSQPVAADGRYAGTYQRKGPGIRITWSWDLRGSDYVTVDGPATIPGSDLPPLVP